MELFSCICATAKTFITDLVFVFSKVAAAIKTVKASGAVYAMFLIAAILFADLEFFSRYEVVHANEEAMMRSQASSEAAQRAREICQLADSLSDGEFLVSCQDFLKELSGLTAYSKTSKAKVEDVVLVLELRHDSILCDEFAQQLSDFLSNCKQEGIKLKVKEDIIDCLYLPESVSQLAGISAVFVGEVQAVADNFTNEEFLSSCPAFIECLETLQEAFTGDAVSEAVHSLKLRSDAIRYESYAKTLSAFVHGDKDYENLQARLMDSEREALFSQLYLPESIAQAIEASAEFAAFQQEVYRDSQELYNDQAQTFLAEISRTFVAKKLGHFIDVVKQEERLKYLYQEGFFSIDPGRLTTEVKALYYSIYTPELVKASKLSLSELRAEYVCAGTFKFSNNDNLSKQQEGGLPLPMMLMIKKLLRWVLLVLIAVAAVAGAIGGAISGHFASA